MIWMAALLDFPFIAASRIGRLVGVVLIKCEHIMPSPVPQRRVLNDRSPHCNHVCLSIAFNCKAESQSLTLLAVLHFLSAILAYHFMGAVSPGVVLRNLDKLMMALPIIKHGKTMRALRSVSIVDEYFLCQTFFRNKATQCLNTTNFPLLLCPSRLQHQKRIEQFHISQR